MPFRLASLGLFVLLALISPAQAQNPSPQSLVGQVRGRLIKSSDTQAATAGPALMSDQIFEKALPSVALVLVGKSPSELAGAGSAIVVRSNGALLTAYHVIKDAKALQIRFKNGEIFDDVQLLGVDQRRDVAALQIAAGALPALPIGSAGAAKPGDAVYVISHAGLLPWSASTGVVSAYRLADEVPGAGSGYRLLQFTASTSPGSSGGVVLDGGGHALALIVGTLEGGQNLNFAVPIENVLGLINSPIAQTYTSGAGLQLPETKEIAKPRVTEAPSVPKETVAKSDVQSDELLRSEVLKSRDPDFILRNFRTLYVDTRKATWFGDTQMKAALGKNNEFTAMRIAVVDDPSLADVVLEVGYTFMWDYPFTLKHQNTSIVLVAGKGGAIGGANGAGSVAKELAKLLKPYRTVPPGAKKGGE